MPLSHIAVPPLTFVAPDVVRERGVVFHTEPGGRADGGDLKLRLDVYRAKPGTDGDMPGPRPAVIQVHGGGWISGSRYEQGVPLLNHLAGRGWVGFNIDYRLAPEATWPDSDRRRQARDRLGPRARRRARHRPGRDRDHGRLRRRASDRARRADRERPRLPARLRGRRHEPDRRRPLLRRLRPDQRLRPLLPAAAGVGLREGASSSSRSRATRSSTGPPRRAGGSRPRRRRS